MLERSSERMHATRRDVVQGWKTMAKTWRGKGSGALANLVRRFLDRMPPPRTERQWIGEQLREHTREQASWFDNFKRVDLAGSLTGYVCINHTRSKSSLA